MRWSTSWTASNFSITRTASANKSKINKRRLETGLTNAAYSYRGFKPISKAYFATSSSKASEQFIYFISLVSWLLAINQHQVTGWNKYDDPMTASQNVMIEL